MQKRITIALAGNPNSGKTTIFNNLTGAHQHVGNYPGVTVERKEGNLSYKEYKMKVIDLPGTYSLSAYSPDELVARNVIIEENPDLVVNVVDSTNLERHLNLTIQLKELGLPIIVVLNMADLAVQQGLKIDYQKLARLLGVNIISMVGTENSRTQDLLDLIISTIEGRTVFTDKMVRFSPDIEKQIQNILWHLTDENEAGREIAAAEGRELNRWLAIKLLENDKEVRKKCAACMHPRLFLSR